MHLHCPLNGLSNCGIRKLEESREHPCHERSVNDFLREIRWLLVRHIPNSCTCSSPAKLDLAEVVRLIDERVERGHPPCRARTPEDVLREIRGQLLLDLADPNELIEYLRREIDAWFGAPCR